MKNVPIKQYRFGASAEAREEVENRILRELSMDARKSLSSIAADTGLSKTTVFNELNRLINEKEISFVPEINLDDMWRHEMLYTTKRMQKRDFRDLDIHTIGFSEYIGFVKFKGKKPSDSEIVKAVSSFYNPQTICGLHGSYDLFMYLVARNPGELNAFLNGFHKSLSGYKMKIRVKPIQRTHGYFPLRNTLISQFKIPEKYKRLLVALNDDARGQLSKSDDIDKTMATYIYKTLLEYGIVTRTTLHMRNSGKAFTGMITYSIINNELFQKNKHLWNSQIAKLDDKVGYYTLTAETGDPYGGFAIISTRGPEYFNSIKRSIESMNLGVKLGIVIVTHTILGNMGIRNFDMRYSKQYDALAGQGLVPRAEREQFLREKRRKGPIYIEM